MFADLIQACGQRLRMPLPLVTINTHYSSGNLPDIKWMTTGVRFHIVQGTIMTDKHRYEKGCTARYTLHSASCFKTNRNSRGVYDVRIIIPWTGTDWLFKLWFSSLVDTFLLALVNTFEPDLLLGYRSSHLFCSSFPMESTSEFFQVYYYHYLGICSSRHWHPKPGISTRTLLW